jgi:hypothetical protein
VRTERQANIAAYVVARIDLAHLSGVHLGNANSLRTAAMTGLAGGLTRRIGGRPLRCSARRLPGLVLPGLVDPVRRRSALAAEAVLTIESGDGQDESPYLKLHRTCGATAFTPEFRQHREMGQKTGVYVIKSVVQQAWCICTLIAEGSR